MKHTKRCRKKKTIFIIVLLILTGLILISSRMTTQIGLYRTADLSYGWNLILVNDDYRIPDNYRNEIKLTTLSNGKQIDSRIYPFLQVMFDDARSAGLQLFVREGYRTREQQQKLLEDKINVYRDEGYSKFEAEKLAKEWVAIPGTSEHEIGIAVDINADTSVCSEDELYSWLENNAYKYGFIKRYPSNKTDITGVSNEPWHYRYVGKNAAEEMYSEKICLEEYVKRLQ